MDRLKYYKERGKELFDSIADEIYKRNYENNLSSYIDEIIRCYEFLIENDHLEIIEELIKVYSYKNYINKNINLIDKILKYIEQDSCDFPEVFILDMFRHKEGCLIGFDLQNAYSYSINEIDKIFKLIYYVYKNNKSSLAFEYVLILVQCLDSFEKQQYIINKCINSIKDVNLFTKEVGKYYMSINDEEKMIKYLTIGGNNGDLKCFEILGDYYNYVKSGDKDYTKIIEYYSKCDFSNYSTQINYLNALMQQDAYNNKNIIVNHISKYARNTPGLYYYLGKYFELIKEYDNACDAYILGKKKNDILSMFECAKNYRDGIHIKQDIEESIICFEYIHEYILDNLDITIYEDDYEYKELNKLIIEKHFYHEYAKIYYSNKYSRFNKNKVQKILNFGIQKKDIFSMYVLGKFLIKNDIGELEDAYDLITEAINNGFIEKELDDDFNNKSINDENEIYKLLIEEKNKTINNLKEQVNILKETLIMKLDNTYDIVNNISNQINNIVSSINNIKMCNKEIIEKLDINSKEYEYQISVIQDKILNVKYNIKSELDYEKEYKDLFLNNWDKLDLQSKKFLITARTIFDHLKKCNTENTDYSAICLMICKTVEIELKNRFVVNFIKYLDEKYNKDYSQYHTQLTIYNNNKFKLKNLHSITLGDMSYILCASYLENKKIYNFDRNKKQILDYCNTKLFKQMVDYKYMDDLCYQINKIRNDYRNPACHSGIINYVTAVECIDYVLKTTKFLIRFLNQSLY